MRSPKSRLVPLPCRVKSSRVTNLSPSFPPRCCGNAQHFPSSALIGPKVTANGDSADQWQALLRTPSVRMRQPRESQLELSPYNPGAKTSLQGELRRMAQK
ncbi:hypothetical protein LSTR_LSTR006194 [Laodelphax striatellus]|uniref:Uncharacterized protein n=1 Tax=Laodelphax striatellus TaxID=195883 RepID=A0A482XRP4_LAOST|nr:hypothetical protein LSTR_LSTR006194 [Laodelphax striatellus]